MIPPQLMAMGMSSVLGTTGAGGGGVPAPVPDSIEIDTGPINQSLGGGGMIQYEATDSWIWLAVLAVLVVALFKWR